jgi:hypothetical protein
MTAIYDYLALFGSAIVGLVHLIIGYQPAPPAPKPIIWSCYYGSHVPVQRFQISKTRFECRTRDGQLIRWSTACTSSDASIGQELEALDTDPSCLRKD